MLFQAHAQTVRGSGITEWHMSGVVIGCRQTCSILMIGFRRRRHCCCSFCRWVWLCTLQVRAELIKRIHVLAESRDNDLKAVYCEVRGCIGFMLNNAAVQTKRLSECRVVGLIRLALLLQLALEEGPTAQGGQQQ